MTDKRTPREQVLKELGKFIELKMKEREKSLRERGIIERNMSRAKLGEMVGVSRVWINDIINGTKITSDALLLKIANVLEIDEHEIFKVARRIHPDIREIQLKEYLGEYYIEGINE